MNHKDTRTENMTKSTNKSKDKYTIYKLNVYNVCFVSLHNSKQNEKHLKNDFKINKRDVFILSDLHF